MKKLIASHLPSSSGRKILLLGIMVLAFLAVTSTAWALWYTINTDDHVVDSQWATIGEWDPNLACDDSSLDDRYEMAAAYVTQDGDNIYFRIDTCAVPNMDNIRLAAAFDCNNDGDVDDPYDDTNPEPNGDRVILYNPSNTDQVAIQDGGSTVLYLYQDNTMGEWINQGTGAVFEWRVPISGLYPACRGSIESNGLGLATVKKDFLGSQTMDQSAGKGWSNPMDYGDAPGSWNYANESCTGYQTVLPSPCDGPRHGIPETGVLSLGANIDPDGGGGQLSSDALTDDTTGATPDDEDGVEATYGVVWNSGGSGSIDATVSGGSGYLSCWIDWNDDDDFADAGEQVINDAAVSPGVNTLTFSIPGTVDFSSNGLYYVRCRLAPNSGEGNTSTGPVWNGEVEDYLWLPQATTASIAISGSDVVVSWNHLSQNDQGEQVYKSSTPYFRPENATGMGVVTSSPWQQVDSGLAGDSNIDTFYYKVVGQTVRDGTTIESTPSNEVGLFEFALTPGS